MIKINLIPKEYIEKIDKAILITKIFIVSFFIISFLLLISIWQFTRATALSIELSSKELEYNSLREDVKKADEINKKISQINNYINAIEKISKGRYLYVAFMQDTANNLPDTCWFTGIQTTSKGESISVDYRLSSNSLYDIAWWLSFLENNKRFQNLVIGNITVLQSSDVSVFNVPISLTYVYK